MKKKTTNTNRKSAKQYRKPQVTKHKSVAVVSGSECSHYNSETTGDTYYV
jgi:uncharacterized Ntn-hydrolase superfamily protein